MVWLRYTIRQRTRHVDSLVVVPARLISGFRLTLNWVTFAALWDPLGAFQSLRFCLVIVQSILFLNWFVWRPAGALHISGHSLIFAVIWVTLNDCSTRLLMICFTLNRTCNGITWIRWWKIIQFLLLLFRTWLTIKALAFLLNVLSGAPAIIFLHLLQFFRPWE